MFLSDRKKYRRLDRDSRGSALILTMLIMTGMMIVALGDAYVVLLGIKAAGTQAKSTKAYYVAEAGAERLLWELRKNHFVCGLPDTRSSIMSSADYNGASQCTTDEDGMSICGIGNPKPYLDYGNVDYLVYLTGFPTLSFQSLGNYLDTKRSVEIKI